MRLPRRQLGGSYAMRGYPLPHLEPIPPSGANARTSTQRPGHARSSRGAAPAIARQHGGVCMRLSGAACRVPRKAKRRRAWQ